MMRKPRPRPTPPPTDDALETARLRGHVLGARLVLAMFDPDAQVELISQAHDDASTATEGALTIDTALIALTNGYLSTLVARCNELEHDQSDLTENVLRENAQTVITEWSHL